MLTQDNTRDRIAQAQAIIDARLLKDKDTPINIQIALAKGVRYRVKQLFLEDKEHPYPDHMAASLVQLGDQRFLASGKWLDSSGEDLGGVPNYVGTTESVAMMLWELHHWHVYWVTVADTWHMLPMWSEKVTRHGAGAWVCQRYRDGIGVASDFFTSPFEKPGHCVGEAYLAKLRGEAAGAKG